MGMRVVFFSLVVLTRLASAGNIEITKVSAFDAAKRHSTVTVAASPTGRIGIVTGAPYSPPGEGEKQAEAIFLKEPGKEIARYAIDRWFRMGPFNEWPAKYLRSGVLLMADYYGTIVSIDERRGLSNVLSIARDNVYSLSFSLSEPKPNYHVVLSSWVDWATGKVHAQSKSFFTQGSERILECLAFFPSDIFSSESKHHAPPHFYLPAAAIRVRA